MQQRVVPDATMMEIALTNLKPLSVVVAAAIIGAPALAHGATFNTMYSFQGGTDGAGPFGRLVVRSTAVYGTTADGGANGLGTIFVTNPTTGAEKVLYSFAGGSDGANPQSHLNIVGRVLYGTTESGGPNNAGTVFEYNAKTGKETVLYTFTGGSDGANPVGGVTYKDGALWGTANAGGTGGNGTLFKIDLSTLQETTVYQFKGGADGSRPLSSPIFKNGIFYGNTVLGGANGTGAIWSYTPSTNTESVLHSFGGAGDGSFPAAGLFGTTTTLYGTTQYGGASNHGTVYSFVPATLVETPIYSFTGGADGATPVAPLTPYKKFLYGTAENGGAGYGTVFAIDLAKNENTETTVYTFSGGADGAYPWAGTVEHGGAIYGTTLGTGTAPSLGSVYKIVP
jgi:uncharacterized repeat protein (TIGR03803 family)